MKSRIAAITLTALAGGLFAVSVPSAHGQATTAPAASDVLVLPFSTPAGAADAWVGKAVQQDLLTDLTQGTISHVEAPAAAPPAADAEEAVRTARNRGANIVIYGQAQNAGKDVRLIGQVIDVQTAKPIGSIKATGPTDDLFRLEDALAGQVFVALPRNLLTAATTQGMQRAMASAQQTPQTQQWPNGPYAPPAINTSSIYGSSQLQPPLQSQLAPDNGGTSYIYNNYYDTGADEGDFAAYPGYDYGDSGIWPYWADGFYVSPGWGYGYGRNYGRYGRGGYHFAPGRNGGYSGFARSGAGTVRSLPRASFGTFRAGIGGGFHSTGGAFRSGGFAAGGFHGGGGGGFHGGGGGGHR